VCVGAGVLVGGGGRPGSSAVDRRTWSHTLDSTTLGRFDS
jgi:hypothetical protein